MTNVRWSHDSSQAASIGGADTGLFIWAKVGIEVASAPGAKLGIAAENISYRGASDDSDTDSEEEGER